MNSAAEKPYYLIVPDNLPKTHDEINQAFSQEMKTAFTILLRLKQQLSDHDAFLCVYEALQHIPLADEAVTSDNKSVIPLTKRYAELDDYIGLARVSGENAHIWFYSILETYQDMLDEALSTRVSISSEEWGRLRAAFDTLLVDFAQKHAPMQGNGLTSPAATSTISYLHTARPFDVMYRWKLGHRVFIALLQSLVFMLYDFETAHKQPEIDVPQAQRALSMATTLMWGSAASLRFTGDFEADDYNNVVYPSMTPPYVPPGFSGMQTLDHLYTVRVLSQLRPLFMTIDPALAEQHQQFISAFTHTYDSHKFVCARFQGDQRPSIRMSLEAKQTAVDVIEKLKQARLKNIQL
jgi:hypothetical protein